MPLPVLKNYINNEWVAAQPSATGNVWNPATGKKIAVALKILAKKHTARLNRVNTI